MHFLKVPQESWTHPRCVYVSSPFYDMDCSEDRVHSTKSNGTEMLICVCGFPSPTSETK